MKVNETLYEHFSNFLPQIAENIKIWHSINGYYDVSGLPDHFLANKKGVIPAHRLLCYEIRYKDHVYSPCHWCGYPLFWKVKYSGTNKVQSMVVNVDHIDGNNANNDPLNLIASCYWCNSNRSWADKDFFESCINEYKTVAPWMRPSMVDLGKMYYKKTAHELLEKTP
jgi:hypothetical protein